MTAVDKTVDSDAGAEIEEQAVGFTSVYCE